MKTAAKRVYMMNETNETRRALSRAHVPPTKVFPRLTVNKTILKPRVAAATGAQYLYVGFSRRNKIPRCSAYDIGESYPVPASGSGSGSKVNQVHVPTSVDTQHFILSNVDNRQTDRQTNERTRANAFTSSFVGGNDDDDDDLHSTHHIAEKDPVRI